MQNEKYWIQNDIENITNWEPPEFLKLQCPYDDAGKDIEGAPGIVHYKILVYSISIHGDFSMHSFGIIVLIAPFGIWDVRRIMEMGLKSEYIRYVDQLFIKCFKKMDENPDGPSQIVCIFIPDQLQMAHQAACFAGTNSE